MIDLCRYLIEGKNITPAFQEAFEFWKSFLSENRYKSLDELQNIINRNLLDKFTENFSSIENKSLTKNIFVLSAIASFYYIYTQEGTDFYEDNFVKLFLSAIKNSSGYIGALPTEIPGDADIIAKIYDINL